MPKFLQTVVLLLVFVAACGGACSAAQGALNALLSEQKFEPHGLYAGADTPEDREPLQKAVDNAISDIDRLPSPLNEDAVRRRLSRLIEETGLYATEDREEVARYAIRIWRAAGFTSESHLFPVSDAQVLALP